MKSFQKIILIKVLVILFTALIVLNISQYNEINKLKNNNNNNNNNNKNNKNNNIEENNNNLKRELKVFIPKEVEITTVIDDSIDKPEIEIKVESETEKELINNNNNNNKVEEEVQESQVEEYREIKTISDEVVLLSTSENDYSLIIDFDNNVEFVKGDKPKYRFCNGCLKCNNDHHNKKHLIISN